MEKFFSYDILEVKIKCISILLTSNSIITKSRYNVKKIIKILLKRREMFYENLDKILKKKNLTLNKLAKGTGIAQSQTTK